jgi:hypothetical protein
LVTVSFDVAFAAPAQVVPRASEPRVVEDRHEDVLHDIFRFLDGEPERHDVARRHRRASVQPTRERRVAASTDRSSA